MENNKQKGNFYIAGIVYFGFLVLVMAIMLKNIFTLKMNKTEDAYNPYLVLGIDEFTPEKAVKKAYKKLLKPLFKQKKKGNMEEIEKKILEINKAFDNVKNPENYQKFLKSQTKSELFVALPQFILQFANTSFTFYILFLIIALPAIFYVFVIKKRKTTNNGVFYKTTERFYKIVDGIQTDDKLYLMHELMAFMSQTKDFKEHAFLKDLSEEKDFFFGLLKEVAKIDLTENTCANTNEFMQILNVLFRTNKAPKEDVNFVQEKVLKMLECFIVMAEKKNTFVVETLFEMEKLFVQRVPDKSFEILQFLPVEGTEEILKEIENKKREDVESTKFNFLSQKDSDDAKILLNKMPLITVEEMRAFVVDGEKAALNEYAEKVVLEGNNIFKVDRTVNSYVTFKVNIKNNFSPIHAPFYKNPQPFVCTVLIKINGIIKHLESVDSTREIKFVLPEGNSAVKVEAVAVARGYLNYDVAEIIKVKYT